jgi:hypothetical protein
MIYLNSFYKNKEKIISSDLNIVDDTLERINKVLENEAFDYGCLVKIDLKTKTENGRITSFKKGYFEACRTA